MEKVRVKFESLINDYLQLPALDEYIISPGLGDEAGIKGSLLLAKRAITE